MGWLDGEVAYTGHDVDLASRANSSTVTGSVHKCGVGVRGRREMDPARADAFAAE